MEANTEASSSVGVQPVVTQDPDTIFEQLEAHNWNEDAEFLSGLNAIVEPMKAQGATEEQIETVTQRAKVFFFSNKIGTPLTIEAYRAWKEKATGNLEGTTATATSNAAEAISNAAQAKAEPYPASFDKIVELITSGRTDEIPGIKDIPLKINEAPPTEAKLPKRSKPWETKTEEAQ